MSDTAAWHKDRVALAVIPWSKEAETSLLGASCTVLCSRADFPADGKILKAYRTGQRGCSNDSLSLHCQQQ